MELKERGLEGRIDVWFTTEWLVSQSREKKWMKVARGTIVEYSTLLQQGNATQQDLPRTTDALARGREYERGRTVGYDLSFSDRPTEKEPSI